MLLEQVNPKAFSVEESGILSIDSTVILNCNDSQGTAFLVRENLYMTAKHVVTGCKNAVLIANNGEKTKANVAFVDSEFDVALLAAEKSVSKLIKFNSDPIEKGKVEIVGAPIDGLVLSAGSINYVSSNGPVTQLHLTIPADHGNSGGPVFLSNEIVGMVYLKNFENGEVIAYGNPTLFAALNHYDLQNATADDSKKLVVLGSELNQLWLLIFSIIINLFFLSIALLVYFKNKGPRYIVGRNRIKIQIK